MKTREEAKKALLKNPEFAEVVKELERKYQILTECLSDAGRRQVIVLDEDLTEELEAVAARLGVDASEVILRALALFFEKVDEEEATSLPSGPTYQQ